MVNIQYNSAGKFMWQRQDPSVLAQANPNQNQWYDALPAQFGGVRIYGWGIRILVANETLEVQALVDGAVLPSILLAAVFNQNNAIRGAAYPQTGELLAIQQNNTYTVDKGSFIIEGQAVQLQVRKTTAAGAGTLHSIVDWGLLRVCP